jgi:hypothetical protein
MLHCRDPNLKLSQVKDYLRVTQQTVATGPLYSQPGSRTALSPPPPLSRQI